jgi:ribosomal protein L16 Arg81 hydroxylase
MNLRYLMHPIDPETFKRDYWEKKPLTISRKQPSYYHELLSPADMDHVLSNSSVHPSQIRVVHDGKEIQIGTRSAAGLIGTAGLLEELYAAYRGGSTLIIQFLHERWKPLRLLCQALATEFSARCHVNVYLTPAHEKGFNIHYDTHDVFILQSKGVKHWCLYESPFCLPLKGQPCDAETMKPGTLLDEFDLQAGDFLYLPRGAMHAAASCDSASQHLTVGIHTVTWATVVLRAIESAIEHDLPFRESLPVGFAHDQHLQERAQTQLRSLLARLGEQIDPATAIREAVEEARLGRQSALEGHLLDLDDMNNIDLTTRVRRQREAEWRLTKADNVVSLRGHGKAIEMPAHTWPELSFILEGDHEFSATDFPGQLDTAGRLTLVRSLVREGFLTICRSPTAHHE